jgi:hypothetical protein
MKVFTVYKHESKGYEAVKVGFSWPAFFFSGLWMLGKGFIFLFIFYIIVIPLINFYLYDGPQTPNEWFVGFIGVLLWFYPGFYGNSWLNKKYIDNGYTDLKAISASSKEAAIALAKNDDIDNTSSSNSLEDIDEASELIYDKSYTNAYSEIQQYEIDKDIGFIKNQDIWARAYALSDGDENKQKVIYVNLQAKELDFEYDFEADQAKKKKNNKGLVIVGIVLIAIVIFANTF